MKSLITIFSKARWLGVVACFSIAAYGQTGSLTLSAGSPAPGGKISMNITLASGAGQAPAALEWTLSYLGSDILDIAVAAGSAMQVSGKNIACNQLPGNDTCLATGLNASGIPDGVIATVTVTPSPTAGTGLSNLMNTVGSDPLGNSLAISAFKLLPGGGPTQIPVTTMATPLPGTGITQTFLITIRDPDGFANITTLGIGFLDATSQPSSCYSLLNFPGKELFLINDDGLSYHNPAAVFGASGSVANSYCRIDTSAVTVSGAGAVLTIALPVTFKTSGVKNIYAYATNVTGGSETYHALGSWTAPGAAATLSVAEVHNGNFSQGQTGSYTLTVSNVGTAATNGTVVTVVDTLPTGLTAAAMSGAGWNCNVSTASCTRNDSLPQNTTYPPINFTVNIALSAGASLTNQVQVSGGGQSATASDTVLVTRMAASISATGGTAQNTMIGALFAIGMQATVLDGGGAGLGGITVTFADPASGASGTFAGGRQTAVTNTAGVATAAAFTANNTAGSYMVTAVANGAAGNANFALINNAGAAATITATSGYGQSASIGTAFAARLVATVKDLGGNPIAGFAVTFTAPSSGASGTFMGQSASLATTNTAGVATSPVFMANNTPGGYAVIASTSDIRLSGTYAMNNSGPPGPAAAFVKSDSITQGNWRSAYGADGYNINGDLASNPSYGSPSASGAASYTWASSTSDIRALQQASNAGARIAGTWYAAGSFLIDSNITDSAPHQVALYFLDWDSTGRREVVDVLDSNGAILDTQALSTSFNGGVYLVWNVTGRVKFRVTLAGGTNAVLSGLFFGGSAGPAAATAAATFVKTDITTRGNWQSAYGADGYQVVGDLASNPSYAAWTTLGNGSYTWAASTYDVRALQKMSNPADRIAATWYASSSFLIDSNITDSVPQQVALYFLDWDTSTRRETIEVLDSNGAVLNTQALTSSLNGGVYLVWNVTGHVKFRVTYTGGINAILSGLFFGGARAFTPPSPATAAFVKMDSTTQGNWRSIYGADGYSIVGDLASNPSYATPAAFGQMSYTWTGSTGDVRAPQKASNAADRIAATWYSGSPFFIETNITDSAPHQVALYCLDWDTLNRRQTIEVLDPNGTVLDTQSITASFNGGVYLVWNVTGRVRFRITATAGYNAVVSGLFFH